MEGSDDNERDGKQPSSRSMRPGGPKALIGLVISDRYKIERLLGEGGMGAVYQAEHTLMRKRMAIKVLHPEMTRLPEVVARFEREAMAAAHIEHPNVVTATDFGKLDDGSFFLALEFVEGKSLRDLIGLGKIELGRALHIARQIAAALQRAHALKIVHRDLKPENVMLVERDGDPDFVKVLDFGIAKVQIGELGTNDPEQPGKILTQAGMVYGTPEYMAPEQALGQPVDPRADIYALGIIMFEMLTGARPFEAGSKVALLGMQVTAPVPPMASKNPDADVPPEVEALVKHLLAKEAAERAGEAKDVIDAINTLLAQLAANGRVDPRYAPVTAPGMITNPGLLAVITPNDLGAQSPISSTGANVPVAMRASGPSPAAAMSGAPGAGATGPSSAATPSKGGSRLWLVAAGAGTLGIVVLVAAILVVVRGREVPDAGVQDAEPVEAAIVAEPSVEQRVTDAIAMINAGDYGSGIKKLEDVEPQADDREDVHRALLTAYEATDKPREAMREAGLVLKVAPNINLREEVKLRVAVRDTALKEGSREPSQKVAADDAFALLEDKMGTVGWDDLYDIGYGSSGAQYPKAAARARNDLTKGERSKMTPSLQVTVDMQSAGATCGVAKHFDRAVKEGDERTLALLRQLKEPRIVGAFRKVDALACIHGPDHPVDKAIADLDARLKPLRKK